MGAIGPFCSERINSSQSAEVCHGQACLLRYLATTTCLTSQHGHIVVLKDFWVPKVLTLYKWLSHLSSSVWIRWRMDPWSPCSANCGGGSQTRRVRCMKGLEGRSREVESKHCLGTGRRPSTTRLCNLLPCARWATTHWGAVSLLTLTSNTSRHKDMDSVKAVYLGQTQSTSHTVCRLSHAE